MTTISHIHLSHEWLTPRGSQSLTHVKVYTWPNNLDATKNLNQHKQMAEGASLVFSAPGPPILNGPPDCTA